MIQPGDRIKDVQNFIRNCFIGGYIMLTQYGQLLRYSKNQDDKWQVIDQIHSDVPPSRISKIAVWSADDLFALTNDGEIYAKLSSGQARTMNLG